MGEGLVLGGERHHKKLLQWSGCSQIRNKAMRGLELTQWSSHIPVHFQKDGHSTSHSSCRRTETKLISPQQGQAFPKCHPQPTGQELEGQAWCITACCIPMGHNPLNMKGRQVLNRGGRNCHFWQHGLISILVRDPINLGLNCLMSWKIKEELTFWDSWCFWKTIVDYLQDFCISHREVFLSNSHFQQPSLS